MDEPVPDGQDWGREAAAIEAAWRRRAAEQEARWRSREVSHDEVLRQQSLMQGGLVGIGIVMVQPFLTAGPEAFDFSASVCVVAFAVAIPILAALVVLNALEMYHRRVTSSRLVAVARQGAFGVGFVGVVAGFWHIMPAAGIAVAVAALVAVAVLSSGYLRVASDEEPEEGSSGS